MIFQFEIKHKIIRFEAAEIGSVHTFGVGAFFSAEIYALHFLSPHFPYFFQLCCYNYSTLRCKNFDSYDDKS